MNQVFWHGYRAISDDLESEQRINCQRAAHQGCGIVHQTSDKNDGLAIQRSHATFRNQLLRGTADKLQSVKILLKSVMEKLTRLATSLRKMPRRISSSSSTTAARGGSSACESASAK